jgi:hypothetical protein
MHPKSFFVKGRSFDSEGWQTGQGWPQSHKRRGARSRAAEGAARGGPGGAAQRLDFGSGEPVGAGGFRGTGEEAVRIRCQERKMEGVRGDLAQRHAHQRRARHRAGCPAARVTPLRVSTVCLLAGLIVVPTLPNVNLTTVGKLDRDS